MEINELQREYKELYHAERSFKNELESAIDRPISLITIFSGVLYFVFSKMTQPWSNIEIFLVGLIIVTLCIIAYAIWCLIQSYIGYTYAIIPTPLQIETYRIKTLKYNDGDSEKTNEEVLKYIYSSFAEAADQNAMNNDKKSAYLYSAKQMIILALPLVISITMIQIISALSFFK